MTTDLTSAHGVVGTPLPLDALSAVPKTDEPQKPKDYTSDQEVRWCPGCGDYVILATIRALLPKLGLKRENITFISGIGCSSRFPYYLETYGMHSIHGRAPAIATGLATTREDQSGWVLPADGDAMSIAGTPPIHTLRRNVNLNIPLFNNRIYALTKGHYSPTSETGKVTKSSPMGSLDHPFNTMSLALGAEGTFIARALDSDRKGLTEVLDAAARHRGTSFVEILQDCPIFNDGSFDLLRKEDAGNHLIPVRHGEKIIFGDEGQHCVIRKGFSLAVAATADVDPDDIIVHDAHTDDPTYANALANLSSHDLQYTVTGIIRQVQRDTYDDLARQQVALAKETNPADLQALIDGPNTWTVD